MNLNEMKLGDLAAVISGLAALQSPQTPSGIYDFSIGKPVLIRTYSSGVHFGTLAQRAGDEALLLNAKRIWKWEGAFTLSEIANNGISDGKISEAVSELLIKQVIEVIPLSANSFKNLNEQKIFRP